MSESRVEVKMTNRQLNKYAMYRNVHAVFGKHQAVWNGRVGVTGDVTELGKGIASIKACDEKIEAPTQTVTALKQKARDDLAMIATEVAGALSAYGRKIGDAAFAEWTTVTKSDFARGRVDPALTLARRVHTKAEECLAALADYGIDETRLGVLKTRCEALDTKSIEPRQVTSTKKALRVDLQKLFDDLDTLLTDSLDKLMLGYAETASEFYNAYQVARVIIDIRATREAGETEAPAMPAASAAATA